MYDPKSILNKKSSLNLTVLANQKTREREYWMNQFSEQWEKNHFPYDIKSSMQSPDIEGIDPGHLAVLEFTFTGEDYNRLIELSRGNNYALHAIGTAALAVLLYKYTGAKDIAIGTPIYQPQQPKDSELSNTLLILRIQLENDMTFKELLLEVKQITARAVESCDYPIEILAEQLKKPMFAISIALENIQDKNRLQPVKHHMNFSLRNNEKNLAGVVAYNSSLYHRETVEQIIAHYLALVGKLTFNVSLGISQVDILSEKEKKQLLYEFNQTKTLFPGAKTIYQWFEEQVEKKPENIAVCSPIHLNDIYDYLETPGTNAELNEKIGTCCFKKNPYIHRSQLESTSQHISLAILKTHRHNSVIVNHNLRGLIEQFDGKRNIKSIYSRLKELTKAKGLTLEFLVYSMNMTDLLEVSFQFNPKAEIFSVGHSHGGDSDDSDHFFELVKILYKNHLIELVGMNHEIPLGERGIEIEGFKEEKSSAPGIPLENILFKDKKLAKARVLLLGDTPGIPTTGLLYLGSYLVRAGINARCQFYDPSRDYPSMKKNIEELLENLEPQVVAISMKWFLYLRRVIDMGEIVKEYAGRNSLDIKVIVGGNTASYYAREILKYDCIDYLVRGEGEEPLLRICRGEDIADIPNCVYKDQGKIIENPVAYLENEDNCPGIYLSHLDELLLSNRAALFGTFFIYTHKGCAMNCLYCGGCRTAQQKTFNRQKVFKRRTIEVRKDILEAKPFTATFQFDFDIPGKDLLDYCKQIWDGIDLADHFCIFSVLTPPSSQLIELVSKTFKYIYWDFDICTLSERHRKQLESLGLVKPQPTDEEIMDFFVKCEKYSNIEVRLNLITGLPYFTTADIEPAEKLLDKIMNTFTCFSELHWARLHAQPGAPIVPEAGKHDMFSYAATFEDFLKYSRENFNRQLSYTTVEKLNYPYIYYNDDRLNAGITAFYLENQKKIEQYRERKKRGLVLSSTLSYETLNERADQLAGALKAGGAGPGTIVALKLEPSLQIPVSILAVLKTGAAYLPIDPDYPQERIDYMLKDSGARILINKSEIQNPKSETNPNDQKINVQNKKSEDLMVLNFEHLDFEYVSNFEFRASDLISSNPAYIIYTSGTTGKPKGVLLTHESLANYVHWFIQTVKLTPGDKTILTSSYAFDLGYTSLYPSLLAGGQLHIIPKETYLFPQKLLGYIKQNRITYLKVTPSYFSIIAHSSKFSPVTCASLRLVVIGGEAINPGDIKKARQICGHIEIMNHYGPTEATIGCIATVIDFNAFEAYQKHPVIGKPIANTSIYILDKELRLLPPGVPGELCIAGACLAGGYLNRPELTAERFYRSYKTYILYKTGDLARWKPDGTIEFLGRIDNQVKIRGYRIELGEIENQLLKHNKIESAVVIDRESEDGDKYLCAYYVPKKSQDAACAGGAPSLLVDKEKTRYSRQMLLEGWGIHAQEKLKQATVFVGGAGGGASSVIMQLALAGVGTIIICDYDNVELSNLNRQFLHDESRIGMNKALSAKITIDKINPHVNVIPITEKLTRENVFDCVKNASIIFDMFDDLTGKFILSQCAAAANIPHIIAAMTDISSYAAVLQPPRTPCFHCIFDKDQFETLVSGMKTAVKENQGAGEYQKNPLPVAVPSLFVSTGFAVNEAIKILLGIRKPAYNKFFFFNQAGMEDIGKSESFRAMTTIYTPHFRGVCRDQGFDWNSGWRGNFLEELDIVPDPDCPVCGKKSKSFIHTGQPTKANEIAIPLYSLSQLREYLLQALPQYMVPSYFVPLEEIPLTPNGKLDKNALPLPGSEGGANREHSNHVAPRNPLEEKLAALWQEVLFKGGNHGMPRIGIDDNFFHLGGHSLKVTLLASKVQEHFHISLSLADIFAAPTIRAQAQYLFRQPEENLTRGVENLVLLRKGIDKSAHLFLVHSGSGEVDGYLEFCKDIYPGFNCWGLRSVPLENYTPRNLTIEKLARAYVEKIKKIQSKGPYHIAGWCIGGMIAFEMVSRLEQMSEEIDFFALFNTHAPEPAFNRGEAAFTLQSELAWILKNLADPGIVEKIKQVARMNQLWPLIVAYLEESHFDPTKLRRIIPGSIADATPNFDRQGCKELIYYFNMIRSINNARNRYLPCWKNRTRLHFFGAAESEIMNKDMWNNHCVKPVEFYQVSGDHFSIFKPPQVAPFARLFNEVLTTHK